MPKVDWLSEAVVYQIFVSARPATVDQTLERVIAAEMRVDVIVIAYIVFVVGYRCENGREINTANPEVIEYLCGVGEYWIKEYGIDGWRLDVSDEVSHEFWRTFRKRIKALGSDKVLIGENWHDSRAYLMGDQFDSIMNYAFTKGFAFDYKHPVVAVECDVAHSERLRFFVPQKLAHSVGERMIAPHKASAVIGVVPAFQRYFSAVVYHRCNGGGMREKYAQQSLEQLYDRFEGDIERGTAAKPITLHVLENDTAKKSG